MPDSKFVETGPAGFASCLGEVVTCLPVIQEVLHRDRDFEAIATFSALRQRTVG